MWQPWLLGSEFGGLRPWEMDMLKAREWDAIVRYRARLLQEQKSG